MFVALVKFILRTLKHAVVSKNYTMCPMFLVLSSVFYFSKRRWDKGWVSGSVLNQLIPKRVEIYDDIQCFVLTKQDCLTK